MKAGKNFQSWGHIEHFRDDIVTIGDNVVLGNGSVIITHCPMSFYNGKPVAITIGNNVYIGACSLILPGVTIGNDVVIGAGSVVSRDIPSGSIAAGNPCAVVKQMSRMDAERIRRMAEQGIVADGTEPDWNDC